MNRARRTMFARRAFAGVVALAVPALALAAPEDADPIAKYLADLSPGAVSAGEMLGLSSSAISNLQAPKDFVAALQALSSGSGKAGFGLSFTPARTRFAPVSISDYRQGAGSRLWAGTTFSYAQNVNTQGGVDYKQEAMALHLAMYLDKADDPALAGYEGFAKCTQLSKMAFGLAARQNQIFLELMKQPGVDLDQANLQAKQQAEKEQAFSEQAAPVYKACVSDAVDRAKAKWNASQVGLTVGQGWIQGPDAGAPRLSLGRSASLALALGPNPDSLVNVTVRSTRQALDVSTIATTPDYKNSTLVAARWTYRALQAQDLYALAEISTAKGSSTGVSNSTFKSALGIDKRLSEGLWLELRVGRNRTADGKADQTTTLLNLKLSPGASSTLTGQ